MSGVYTCQVENTEKKIKHNFYLMTLKELGGITTVPNWQNTTRFLMKMQMLIVN